MIDSAEEKRQAAIAAANKKKAATKGAKKGNADAEQVALPPPVD